MSAETSIWLNNNTLIGFTEKRGHAWHYRADAQGEESNHYTGAIPVEDVKRRLFSWSAMSGPVESTLLVDTGVMRVTDPTRQVIARSDTGQILGVFKSGYQIHQFGDWLVDNVSTILDDDLQIGSAGLLKGGAVAWVSVEVPDTITTPEGVAFRPHLLACTSHDGSMATTYKRVVQLVVCDNTLAIARREEGQVFRVKHTTKSLNRVAEARDALAIVHAAADDFAAEVERLTQIEVTGSDWQRFLDAHIELDTETMGKRAVTLAEKKRDQFNLLWNHDERVSPWRGTALGVLQADNTWRHHLQTVRGVQRGERNEMHALDGTTESGDASVLRTLERVLVG